MARIAEVVADLVRGAEKSITEGAAVTKEGEEVLQIAKTVANSGEEGSHVIAGTARESKLSHVSKEVADSLRQSLSEKTLGHLSENVLEAVDAMHENALTPKTINKNVVSMSAVELAEHFSNETREILLSNRSVSTSLANSFESLNKTITKMAKDDQKFTKFLASIWKGTKVVGIVAIIAATTAYVVNYIQSHSGPYLITKHEKQYLRQRIKSPYPCGFMEKDGDITHPLDVEIKALVNNPCDNYKEYDLCGGWTNFDIKSRFFQLSRNKKDAYANALKKLKNRHLTCESATIADGLEHLAKAALSELRDVVTKIANSFCSESTIFIIITAVVTFFFTRLLNFSLLVSVIFTIVVCLCTVQFLKLSKPGK